MKNIFWLSFLFPFALSHYDKRDSEGSIFLLCGERGCGKSSLAARWLQEFRTKNPRIPAIPHFCGISSSSVDIRSVLRRITTELRLAHYGKHSGVLLPMSVRDRNDYNNINLFTSLSSNPSIPNVTRYSTVVYLHSQFDIYSEMCLHSITFPVNITFTAR